MLFSLLWCLTKVTNKTSFLLGSSFSLPYPVSSKDGLIQNFSGYYSVSQYKKKTVVCIGKEKNRNSVLVGLLTSSGRQDKHL